jgi:hypothetical protein
MIRKTLLLALALAALAGAFAGCGGDDCTRANDQLTACIPPMMSSSGAMTSTATACAGADLCRSECINNATCTQIAGMAPAYTACLAACKGK